MKKYETQNVRKGRADCGGTIFEVLKRFQKAQIKGSQERGASPRNHGGFHDFEILPKTGGKNVNKIGKSDTCLILKKPTWITWCKDPCGFLKFVQRLGIQKCLIFPTD